MGKTERRLPDILDKLRWIVPMLLAAFGAGYTLFDHLFIPSGLIDSAHILREALVIGIVGPTLASLFLTWATSIARSRQEVLESLKRRALQLEAASQVSQKVTAILEVDELLAQVVQLIRDKFGYYSVHIFLVDGHSNQIVLRACNGPTGEALKTRKLHLKIGKQGITGRVAETGQPIMCNDIAQEPRYHPHELLPETRAELAIPLRIGDIVVGVLDVQSDQPNTFREDDMTTLQLLGDQVAIAIENANLFRETRRQFKVMHGLHRISLDITSQLESEQVLAAILEQAVKLLNAQASALALHKPETNSVDVIAIYNLPAEFKGMKLQVGEGVAGHVVATKAPLIVNDYQHWSGRSQVFLDSPYDAVVSVPLRWEGQVFGALMVVDRGERRPFTEDDVRVLNLFADLASIALKNAELYAQVIQFNQQLEQKVRQRTQELVKAQEELAQKAEQLQQLLAKMVRVQEEERSRIALDLHDGSNQLITGTLFEIQAAQQNIVSQHGTSAFDTLETAKRLLRQVEAENRRIISGLRPPILDAQGLVPTLKWHAATCQNLYGISCSVQVLGQPIRLSPETEIAIYRVVQESLNNIAVHAQARNAQIQINFRPACLHVVVEDDGAGFAPEAVLATAVGQMGLIGMRERIQSIGGRAEIHSRPGQGTRLVFDVPLSSELALHATTYES
jgi:signal transduction histidine kinase